jgi:glucosamine--fructose-6-phosphate aminotransferase (isomerizing)
MCGIVGYIGPADAKHILLDGLRKLEYRGYDSAGLAIQQAGELAIRKRQGKIDRLAGELDLAPVEGMVGIGHTRWATHGAPSDDNAHPHVDCAGRMAVVHNGIIENYLALRESLEGRGHQFRSETDTEVFAHLIESHYAGDLYAAVVAALREVVGSYALVVMSLDAPDTLIAARQHSPLILGHGEQEQFIASDVPAVLAYTRKVTYLQNGEVAVLNRDGVRITRLDGTEVSRDISIVAWDAAAAEKGGYKHFMLKEINEQPTALEETLRGRISEDGAQITLPGLKLSPAQLSAISRVLIIACGTAYHAGLVGKYAIEQLARLPVEIDVASELRYRDPIIDEGTLAIVISQSGETADTQAGLHEARDKGAHVLAVTNVVGSSVDRDADSVLYTYAGPEIAVASTKAYTTQLMVMYLTALYLAQERGTMPDEARIQLIDAVRRIPSQTQTILEGQEAIHSLADRFDEIHSSLFLGRGVNFPTALEGALKLKEISYIHAEGYAAGEMKHGPIALITPQCPTVAVAVPGGVYDKMLSNIKEVKARAGHVIAVGAEGDGELHKYADDVIRIPRTVELFTPVLAAVPLQLLAYYCADNLGMDIDQPRNLAKSVTVE